MNARMLAYRFGFRLACLIAMLIALSIMVMTYFFVTRETEAAREISRCFEKIVIALVVLLGHVIRTIPRLTSQQTSGTRRNRSLSNGQLRSKGKGNGVRSRRRRDPQKK